MLNPGRIAIMRGNRALSQREGFHSPRHWRAQLCSRPPAGTCAALCAPVDGACLAHSWTATQVWVAGFSTQNSVASASVCSRHFWHCRQAMWVVGGSSGCVARADGGAGAADGGPQAEQAPAGTGSGWQACRSAHQRAPAAQVPAAASLAPSCPKRLPW